MKIKSENIGKEIALTVYVTDSSKPEPILTTAVYDCMGCMKKYEIYQKRNQPTEPQVCTDCGGSTFTLSHSECIFSDQQRLTCLCDGYTLHIYLRGTQCQRYDEGMYTVVGTLGIDMNTTPFTYHIHSVVDIRKRR